MSRTSMLVVYGTLCRMSTDLRQADVGRLIYDSS